MMDYVYDRFYAVGSKEDGEYQETAEDVVQVEGVFLHDPYHTKIIEDVDYDFRYLLKDNDYWRFYEEQGLSFCKAGDTYAFDEMEIHKRQGPFQLTYDIQFIIQYGENKTCTRHIYIVETGNPPS